ncbi:MAG: exosortase U [Planctomycetota bacterium]
MTHLPFLRPIGFHWLANNHRSLTLGLLFAQLPLVFHHCWNLWQFRPHYGFAPVLLIVTLALLRERWQESKVDRSRQTESLARLGWAIGVLTTLFAVGFVYPWLGSCAWIITLGAWIVEQKGRNAAHLFGPWALLWLLVPPPFGFDQQLIRIMQSQASHFVSSLMDCFAVPHYLSGNVFQLEKSSLFIAEACSGMHSQGILVSAALVYCVYRRMRLPRVLVFVMAAVFWSLVMNVTRISIVVALKSRWQIDWESGIAHECLGLVLVTVAFGLVFSTDQLLKGLLLFGHRIGKDETVEFDPLIPSKRTDQQENRSSHRLIASYLTMRMLQWLPAFPPRRSNTRRSFFAVSGLLLLMMAGTLQLGAAVTGPTPFRDRSEPVACMLQHVPLTVESWQQIDRVHVRRQRGSDEGQASDVFRYTSPTLDAQASIDYPFFGWHELPECYRARGWKIEAQRVDRFTTQPGGVASGATIYVDMIGPDGEHGLLVYCLFDAKGHVVGTPSADWLRRIRSSVVTGAWNDDSLLDPRTVQLQVLAVTDIPLSVQQRESVAELFAAIQGAWHLSRQADCPNHASPKKANR